VCSILVVLASCTATRPGRTRHGWIVRPVGPRQARWVDRARR